MGEEEECSWEWNGIKWILLNNTCVSPKTCDPPTGDGYFEEVRTTRCVGVG